MKLTSLHPFLQKSYPNKRGYGVERGPKDQFSNIWFVVPPPPSDQPPLGLKMDLLRSANEILNKLPPMDGLNTLDQLVLSLLVRREALQSSRIEGTFATIEQVLTPSANIEIEGRSASASVIAYAHALEKSFGEVKKKGLRAFTKQLVRDLHREMMSRDPHFNGAPGVFRNEIGDGVYATIGGLSRIENSIYNPVPPAHLIKTLNENLAWMKDEESVEKSRAGMAPGLVVRMARGHSHFEAIHPFTDGNGRVGRMLMALQMASEGITPLYLSGFIEKRKQDYYSALSKAQTKLDDVPMIHFLCEAVIEAFDESQKNKKILKELPMIWSERATVRQKSAAQRLFSFLLEAPIVTVKLVQQKLEISQPAAKRAIDQLIVAKVLRERTGNGRNRIFAAEEVIEILARPFGERPSVAIERARSILHF